MRTPDAEADFLRAYLRERPLAFAWWRLGACLGALV